MLQLNNTRGFSLIELMIVVTIIGILASIAIPSYQKYTQRARFAEVISIAQVYKTAVSIALQQGIPLSDINQGSNGIPDTPKPTKQLANLSIAQGVITAVGTPIVNEATYILTPNDDGTTWIIGGTCLQSGLCND